MLGHCYPVSPDWLKKIMSHFDINTLIAKYIFLTNLHLSKLKKDLN